MRVGVIGIGQAGGRITDSLLESVEKNVKVSEKVVPFSFAINTAKSDLMGLKRVPKKNRILIGQTVSRGHGVGLKRNVSKRIIKQELSSIKREIGTEETYHLDSFLIAIGLGGGTGSGSAPALAEELADTYELPVHVIGVLPSKAEGKLMESNAARTINELKKVTDGMILFDNEIWSTNGVSLRKSYQMMNYELARAFPFLLQAGETKGKKVGIKVVDASDIMATLDGFSVLGWSEVRAPRRFLSIFRKKTSIDRLDITTRCEMAIINASARTTAQCDMKNVKNVLSLLVGPSEELPRSGIERSRQWITKAMPNARLRSGDLPIRWTGKLARNGIMGILMLSGIRNFPRIKKLGN